MQQEFEKLFGEELADIYDAEQQILKALPKMIDGVTSTELRNALEQHLTVTEGQVRRLDQIFKELGGHKQKKCKGMAGLIAEGEEILKEDHPPHVKDAAIIGAAQKVEHYEMAAYGTVRTFAAFLGNEQAVQLLQETLDEEKEADELLSDLAESSVNPEAAMETGEGDEDSGGGNGEMRRRWGSSGSRSGSAKSGTGSKSSSGSRKSGSRSSASKSSKQRSSSTKR
jgi:ferritin-like metal-binding protein YciE